MAKTKHSSAPRQAPSEGATPTRGTIMKRTLGQSYMALPAQTRLRFSLGVMAFALAGIVFSDILEEKMPAPPPQGQPTQSNAP